MILALAVAVGGGVGSVWYVLGRGQGVGTFISGSWATDPEIGTAEAGPYSKARSAYDGLLVLGRNEGVVFVAERDDAGDTLSRTCRYTIEGAMPPAHFWTLYIAGPGDAPVAGSSGLLNAFNVVSGAGSDLAIAVGASPAPGNWLRVEGDGLMRLVLTLYDTPAISQPSVADVVLPRIVRESCDG